MNVHVCTVWAGAVLVLSALAILSSIRYLYPILSATTTTTKTAKATTLSSWIQDKVASTVRTNPFGSDGGDKKPNGRRQPCPLFSDAMNALYTDQVSEFLSRTIVRVPSWNVSSEETSCSCSNPSALRPCCSRHLVKLHKMGHKLTADGGASLGIKPYVKYQIQPYGPDDRGGDVGGMCGPKSLRTAVLRVGQCNMNLLEGNRTHSRETGKPQKEWGTSDFAGLSRDYREVYVFRDLYDAFVSGYLYHKTGHECWINLNGKGNLTEPSPNEGCAGALQWQNSLTYRLPPLAPEQEAMLEYAAGDGTVAKRPLNLCRYLSVVPSYDGLRAYVEWVMKGFYARIFRRYAISQMIPSLQQRTHIVCYEDLTTADEPVKKRAVKHDLLGFLYDQPKEGVVNTKEWLVKALGEEAIQIHLESIRFDKDDEKEDDHTRDEQETSANTAAVDDRKPDHSDTANATSSTYDGGHATSHDPTLRHRLYDEIKRIDQTYYNGAIQWWTSTYYSKCMRYRRR